MIIGGQIPQPRSLVAWLRLGRGSSPFLTATSLGTPNRAKSPPLLQLALGGFSGHDPLVSLQASPTLSLWQQDHGGAGAAVTHSGGDVNHSFAPRAGCGPGLTACRMQALDRRLCPRWGGSSSLPVWDGMGRDGAAALPWGPPASWDAGTAFAASALGWDEGALVSG